MNNYIGNKGGQGIREFLINYVPICQRYFSLFYGGGGFENSPLMMGKHWICSEINPDNMKYQTERSIIAYKNYMVLIAENDFTEADFIFADPPYVIETRMSKKKLYKFDWEISHHHIFLDEMLKLDDRFMRPNILITHPKCDLYDSALRRWNNIEFEYMTRGGMYKDSIYFNFDPSSRGLLNYGYLGGNFTHRQQIKRKRANLIRKVTNLSEHERQAFFRELNKTMTALDPIKNISTIPAVKEINNDE